MTGSPEAERRWPAEWEPHEATLLAWPVRPSTWPGLMNEVRHAFVRLVDSIAQHERIYLVVPPDAAHADLPDPWRDHPNIRLLPLAIDDSWVRDWGPIVVETAEGLEWVDFRFNSWGQKYPPWDRDDRATSVLARKLQRACRSVPVVLEGGAVETNGRHLAITTRTCLLDSRRNPNITQAAMENILHEYLGIADVVWLETAAGIEGDDTDGHIDQLVRFADPDTIVVAACDDRHDSNYERLCALHREIEAVSRRLDRHPNVVRLPIASGVMHEGERLPASYCNFYLANGACFVPVFGVPEDEPALQILEELLPERRIVPIPCREIIWGLGAVHCLTQSLPAAGAHGDDAPKVEHARRPGT